MSRRKGHHVILRKECDGGQSPNAYVPHITADVRVFYPPHTVGKQEVLEVLLDCVAKVVTQLGAAELGEVTHPAKLWLVPPE